MSAPAPHPSISVTDTTSRTSMSSQRTKSDSSMTATPAAAYTHNYDANRRGSVASTSSTTPQTHQQYQQPTPPESANGEENTAVVEKETMMRKRDYAIEISRIMGQQLVKGMNKGKRSPDRKRSDEDVA